MSDVLVAFGGYAYLQVRLAHGHGRKVSRWISRWISKWVGRCMGGLIVRSSDAWVVRSITYLYMVRVRRATYALSW